MEIDAETAAYLMQGFKKMLTENRRMDMEAFRKPREGDKAPVRHEEGPEALPPECAAGECEHLEHMRDEELEGF